MNIRMILSTIAAAMVLAGCASVPKVDNALVATLDLNRYLGEWYEIARFDYSFERGIEHAKTLRYNFPNADTQFPMRFSRKERKERNFER